MKQIIKKIDECCIVKRQFDKYKTAVMLEIDYLAKTVRI